MAEITKVGTPSLSSILPPMSMQLAGRTAGEAINPYDVIYIKESDGKVYKATGAAATEPARARGYSPDAHAVGDEDVTIYFGDVTVRYGSGLTPGKALYLSGTVPGGLADAASIGGTAALAFVVDATRIRLLQPR